MLEIVNYVKNNNKNNIYDSLFLLAAKAGTGLRNIILDDINNNRIKFNKCIIFDRMNFFNYSNINNKDNIDTIRVDNTTNIINIIENEEFYDIDQYDLYIFDLNILNNDIHKIINFCKNKLEQNNKCKFIFMLQLNIDGENNNKEFEKYFKRIVYLK